MLLFLAALERELSGIIPLIANRRMTLVEGQRCFAGTIAGSTAAVVVTGIGPRRASHASKAATKVFHLDAIVNVGYCGSCEVDLVPGDLFAPGAFTCSESDRRLSPDPRLMDLARQAVKSHQPGNTTLSTMSCVAPPSDKAALGNAGSTAVDMEAYWIAAEAADAGIPFVAIKSVVDGLRDQLPDLTQFQTLDGRFRPIGALKYFSTNPEMLFAAAKLGRNASLASDRLGVVASAFSNLYAKASLEQTNGRPAISNR